MKNLDPSTIPPDLAERMLKVGKIEWGAVSNKTDEQHIADFADSLRITREHFGLEPGNHALNGCYLSGTETVVCHTGTSPNSADHAKIMAGLWNSVIDALQAPQPTAWSHDLKAIPASGFVLATYGDCEGPEVWDAALLRNCLFGENLSGQLKSLADQAAEVKAWALIPE